MFLLGHTYILRKNVNDIILNSHSRRTLSDAMRCEWSVPCPDVARWISAVRSSGRKTTATSSWAGLQVLLRRVRLRI